MLTLDIARPPWNIMAFNQLRNAQKGEDRVTNFVEASTRMRGRARRKIPLCILQCSCSKIFSILQSTFLKTNGGEYIAHRSVLSPANTYVTYFAID